MQSHLLVCQYVRQLVSQKRSRESRPCRPPVEPENTACLHSPAGREHTSYLSATVSVTTTGLRSSANSLYQGGADGNEEMNFWYG